MNLRCSVPNTKGQGFRIEKIGSALNSADLDLTHYETAMFSADCLWDFNPEYFVILSEY